jgi:hypothetical protein
MGPAQVNITLVTEDDEVIIVVLTTPTGPIDLTGRTYRSHVRQSRSLAGTAAAVFTCTVPVPANGEIRMSMDKALTAVLDPAIKYWWDLEETLSGEVSTLILGRVTVVQDVSHA